MLPYITEVAHSYLPKWCTVICRNGAFPVAEFGALLFADHKSPISRLNLFHCKIFLFKKRRFLKEWNKIAIFKIIK